ncbi:protein maintenance of meristems [Quercus suber]|uniref:Protein maintenance of meristems n=1 Tax=Quercus suber TaxID=58331 RepID=A0AAW0LCE8_QUESU
MYLQFFNLISNGKNYSWGKAALSWLYRHLCKASEKIAKQIGGVLLLVQLWAWARFPHICLVIRHPHQALPSSPLAVRWKGAKCTSEHAMHVLICRLIHYGQISPCWVPCLHVVQHANTYGGLLCHSYIFRLLKAITPNVFSDKHATHIAKWAAHVTIADALLFHWEMSYNDEYMVWFRPRTRHHITKETSYWDTLELPYGTNDMHKI